MAEKPKPRSEYTEQVKLAEFLDLNGFIWLHVPNEGKRSKITGAILKRAGMKAGAPDNLIFSGPDGTDIPWAGIAIELKRTEGGRPSVAQVNWIKMLVNLGWKATICEGALDAQAYLKELLACK